MTLTVEDGTGKADADAFVSLADCTAYHAARANAAWASANAADQEAAIRRATAHLSSGYTWKGTRAQGRSQALAWPRSGVTDEEGYAIASDAMPVELVQACCEVALRELATPGCSAPDVTMTHRVKSEQVGAIRVEYAAAPQSPDASRPVMLSVRDLIGGLISNQTSSLVGQAVRG